MSRWIVWVCLACGCADEPPDVAGPPGLARSGGLELIGVSGTRLEDHDSYRVPLQLPRPVTLGQSLREAFVLVNRTTRPVLIERLTVIADPHEWRLLLPTRAREQALAADRLILQPEARLDFDLAVTAQVAGVRRATLELTWSSGPHYQTRRVLIWAQAAPDPIGRDPP